MDENKAKIHVMVIRGTQIFASITSCSQSWIIEIVHRNHVNNSTAQHVSYETENELVFYQKTSN